MKKNEKIIQITSNANSLYGLSNLGVLYMWNANINNWAKVGE